MMIVHFCFFSCQFTVLIFLSLFEKKTLLRKWVQLISHHCYYSQRKFTRDELEEFFRIVSKGKKGCDLYSVEITTCNCWTQLGYRRYSSGLCYRSCSPTSVQFCAWKQQYYILRFSESPQLSAGCLGTISTYYIQQRVRSRKT